MGKHIKDHRTLKKCDVCGAYFNSSQLIKFGIDNYHGLVCISCCSNGIFTEFRKNRERKKKVMKEKKKKNKLDLSKKAFCPSCCVHTYNIDKDICISCNTSGAEPAQRLRQKLEFSEYICPFCYSLNIDLGNKICMKCRAHVSPKSIRKQFRKLDRKERTKRLEQGDATCTICGGKDVWGNINYCFSCKQVYAIYGKEEDGTALKGFVDGKLSTEYVKSIKVMSGDAFTRYKLSVVISRKDLEAVIGIKPVVLDQPKRGETMIKVDAEEFEGFKWIEDEVELTGVSAIAKVRYIEGYPQIPILVSYEIVDFDKYMGNTIPEALENQEKEQK